MSPLVFSCLDWFLTVGILIIHFLIVAFSYRNRQRNYFLTIHFQWIIYFVFVKSFRLALFGWSRQMAERNHVTPVDSVKKLGYFRNPLSTCVVSSMLNSNLEPSDLFLR